MSKPKVVLIAGAAHGGTTIFNMMLGQHTDIFATGKLRDFPHGVVFEAANICSCGAPAADCPFWLEIRRRYQPIDEQPNEEKLPRLYDLISSLSGRMFVGDVTHNVGYAQLLQSIDGIDLYLVHVVRDGRAVVYSRIRKDLRIGTLGTSRWQRIRRIAAVSRHWMRQTSTYSRMEKQLGAKAVRVSYETICNNPRAALRPVGECLGLDFDPIGARLGSGQPFERVPHMIRGNRRLRSENNVVLRRDTSYLNEMPRLDRAIFQLASRVPVIS
jgi:hypothetical protein